MSSRHHKRRGEKLPVPVQRRAQRSLREERQDRRSRGANAPELAKETAQGIQDLAKLFRQSRTLDVGQELPPQVQRGIDKTAGRENAVLQRILNTAYRYETAQCGGRVPLEMPRPTMREGIEFHIVGRNASHEFFLGVKEGKIYRMACGYGVGPEDENGLYPYECNIREVSEEELGDLYIGHF